MLHHASIDGFSRAAPADSEAPAESEAPVRERSRDPRRLPIVRSLTAAALFSPTDQMTCDGAPADVARFDGTGEL
ncbi:MAG: hypothetical protein IID35_08735 [Planctomycetes bacterium]|nr:hypothetical protein [Planctomycetota bacterium]